MSIGLKHIGLAALGLSMIAASSVFPGPTGSQRAILSAAQRFSLEVPEAGSIRWVLQDGSVPEGYAVRQLDEHRIERGDKLSLVVEPVAGETVAAGQALARLRSPLLAQQVAELQAQRRALEARQALMQQGSRPAEVAAAQKEVQLAAARLEKARLLRQQQEQLASSGAGQAALLQQARAEEEIRSAALSLARSGVAVAKAPAQPEAINEISADLQGIADQLEILIARTEVVVSTPIAGTYAPADSPAVAQVFDTSNLYAHFAIADSDRGRYQLGEAIRFHPAGASEAVEGELVAVSTQARTLGGRQVFWASARLPHQPGLQPGMSGAISRTARSSWLREVLSR